MGAGSGAAQPTDQPQSPTLQRRIGTGTQQYFSATTTTLAVDALNSNQCRTGTVKKPGVSQNPTGQDNRNRPRPDQLGRIVRQRHRSSPDQTVQQQAQSDQQSKGLGGLETKQQTSERCLKGSPLQPWKARPQIHGGTDQDNALIDQEQKGGICSQLFQRRDCLVCILKSTVLKGKNDVNTWDETCVSSQYCQDIVQTSQSPVYRPGYT